MRVVLALAVILLLLNLFTYFYREPALDIYHSAAQYFDKEREAIPGIVLLSEQESIQSESAADKVDSGDVVINANEASSNNETETEDARVCWKFESSGDSLETLYERLHALDIPADLKQAGEGGEVSSSLIVEETGHWQLGPGFEERLKIDWPEVTWSRLDCPAIALGDNLH